MTKKWAIRFLGILVLVAALTGFAGCEGDSDSSSDNVDMTGTWISEAGTRFDLHQSEQTITGTCSGPDGPSNPVTGTIINSHVMLTETYGYGVFLRWEGNVSGNTVTDVTITNNRGTVTHAVDWYRQ